MYFTQKGNAISMMPLKMPSLTAYADLGAEFIFAAENDNT